MKKFLAVLIGLLMATAQVSAMALELGARVGEVSLGAEPYTLRIEGATLLEGDTSKGVARFGKLYFHFDATKQSDEAASSFGGSDVANTVPVFVFEGRTQIYPISCDDGREFWLLATETGGGESSNVIGFRDGKWVKYFDTLDVKRRKLLGWDYYLQRFYADGDAIIFDYEHWETKKICRLRYEWDEAAQWFGVEVLYLEDAPTSSSNVK